MKQIAIYARVSTRSQSADRQIADLRDVIERDSPGTVPIVFTDVTSGSTPTAERRQFSELRKLIATRKVAKLYVHSIDRLGRTMVDVVTTVVDISKNADIYVHEIALDTSTPTGTALLHLMASFAELERNLIRERVRTGLALARKRGSRLGRPPKITDDVIARAAALRRDDPTMLQSTMADRLRVSRPTISRILKRIRTAPAPS